MGRFKNGGHHVGRAINSVWLWLYGYQTVFMAGSLRSDYHIENDITRWGGTASGSRFVRAGGSPLSDIQQVQLCPP